MEMKTICPDIAGKRHIEFGFDMADGLRAGQGPRALLSTLASGNMKLDQHEGNTARARLYVELGIEPSRVLSFHLKHSRRVITLKAKDSSDSPDDRTAAIDNADGLIVVEKRLIPSVTVADCMPIWLFDTVGGAFGILHSGWKGTGILMEAVRAMRDEWGSRPEDISVILGPSIGACCYAVPEQRALGFKAEFGEESAYMEESKHKVSTFYLDLRAANVSLAARLGIGRLLDIRLCTSCSPFLGSYRRQGADSFTRMIALCGYF
jgi:YfiH family protein